MKIQKTNSASSKRISCLIYGQPGIGKSFISSTLEGKTLIISAESGLLSLSGFDIDFVEIEGKTSSEKLIKLREVFKEISTEKIYDNIFLDSLSEISSIYVEYYQSQFPDRKDSFPMWGEYSKAMKSFVKALRDLTQYNVVMTALEKSDTDDLQRRIFYPEMAGKISTQIAQYFDEVFNFKMFTAKDGEEKRMLITHPFDNRVAKDRSGKLDKFEDPNLSIIFNKIRGEKNV